MADVRVTNHALLRYLCRRKGINLSKLVPCAKTDSEKLAGLSLFHGVDVESVRAEISGIVKRAVGIVAFGTSIYL